jgi:hypothetical protein
MLDRHPYAPPLFRGHLLALLFFMSFCTFSHAAGIGELLIARGSVWKYLVTGTNPPPTWTGRFYNDTPWQSGAAQLGYGDGDEDAVIGFGPDADTKYITTYFRRSFITSNASDYNQIGLSVVRDDGIVVYLNGTEIYRNNMPPGPINGNTLALTNVAGEAEDAFFSATLNPSALVNGTNVIAVELHQAWPDSIDTSFDLRLTASNAVLVTRGPYLQQGTPTNIIVRWRTSRNTASLIRYGTNLSDLNQIAEEPAAKSEHQLKLTDLLPNTRYYYMVESSENTLAEGPEYFFVTSPSGAKPTRIWVLGDAGTATSAQVAVRDAYYNFAGARHTDMWMMLGDNAYGSGYDTEYQAAVFDIYPDMLRKSVLWPTIGNHDTYSDPQLLDFPYLHIFNLPTDGEAGGIASGTERYYSFDYANIHFVCLDSMSSERIPGAPMLQWLEQDLAANTNQWLIAFWHHPPYSRGSHDSDSEFELVEMRQYVLPILEAYGVDLVLCGHSHSYERSYLIDGHYETSDTLMPEMIVDPGSGRRDNEGPYFKPTLGPAANEGAVYAVAGSSGQTSGGAHDHPVMYISLNLLGSMVLDIDRNELTAQFLQADGAIGDYFTIVKGFDPAALRVTAFDFHEYVANLTWSSVPGRFYVVQFKRDLADDWTDASLPILATQTSTSWADHVPGDANSGFFAVIALPE